MMALLILAGSAFFQVFTLGFQSRSVNAGNYVVAFFCSSIIGIMQVSVWKHIMTSANSPIATAVYSLSGALAICSAIWVHKRFFPKKD